jgi:hypothetical protein
MIPGDLSLGVCGVTPEMTRHPGRRGIMPSGHEDVSVMGLDGIVARAPCGILLATTRPWLNFFRPLTFTSKNRGPASPRLYRVFVDHSDALSQSSQLESSLDGCVPLENVSD